MPQGTIKKIVSDRGFGFITAEGGDIFFHFTSVSDNGFDNLTEGQSVEFEVEDQAQSDKGPRATSVTPV